MPKIPFAKLDLGYASAETESVESPRLLVDGYFDPMSVAGEILDGSRYLCLGYKGAGKSALAEHLRLEAESNPSLFVRIVHLSDFPFLSFGMINTEPLESSSLRDNWAWVLILQLMSSMAGDAGVSDGGRFARNVKILQRVGFLSSGTLKELVVEYSRSLNLKIPQFAELSLAGEKRTQISTTAVLRELRETIQSFDATSRHLIIVDGMDDILPRTELEYQTLSALIQESHRINNDLRRAGVRGKIVILCRTDIFERLPTANKNKLRQDASYELNWYHNQLRASQSRLVLLATRKAQVTDSSIADIVSDYLPNRIHNANSTKSKDVYRFLLERTRHTPRDFLQLLKHIQAVTRDGNPNDDAVRAGFRNYSVQYFLPEIRDEVVGFMSTLDFDFGLQVLSRHRKYKARVADLEDYAKSEGHPDFDVRAFIAHLYEIGAVGLVQTSGANRFYSFRYRNPHVPFDSQRTFRLHFALSQALNIPNF